MLLERLGRLPELSAAELSGAGPDAGAGRRRAGARGRRRRGTATSSGSSPAGPGPLRNPDMAAAAAGGRRPARSLRRRASPTRGGLCYDRRASNATPTGPSPSRPCCSPCGASSATPNESPHGRAPARSSPGRRRPVPAGGPDLRLRPRRPAAPARRPRAGRDRARADARAPWPCRRAAAGRAGRCTGWSRRPTPGTSRARTATSSASASCSAPCSAILGRAARAVQAGQGRERARRQQGDGVRRRRGAARPARRGPRARRQRCTRASRSSRSARATRRSWPAGSGVCGRELCCSSWLREFQPVSVKMVKAQGLALNPSKLAGQCGRLKCCMRYEYQTYLELKRAPAGHRHRRWRASRATGRSSATTSSSRP